MVVILAPATAPTAVMQDRVASTVHMNRAGAAHADAATELGSGEAKLIADHP